VVVAAALSCKFGAASSAIIALAVIAPDSLEQFDTLRPRSYAVNGTGDSVAPVALWTTLDTAALTVLNPAAGQTIVRRPGLVGRLEAQVGPLISNPHSIATLFAADTLRPAGPTLDSLHVPPQRPDSLSDSLKVQLLTDTATTRAPSDSLVPLPGRPVVFTIVRATTPGSVTLVKLDTAHAAGVTVDTVATSALGIATVKLRLLRGPVPDTVLVTASARRAVRTAVPGSPDTFVVRFLP
jgi:hypothetical protein